MPTSTPQFFANANGNWSNVSIQNIQGHYYYGVADSDWTELNSMTYASNAGYDATKRCLSGTRTVIIDELEDWALGKTREPRDHRMTWLNGAAGTGKSCIAHTIALRLKQTGNLGSFIAFHNSYLSEKRHEKVFSTIARDLAARNVAFRKALAETLRKEGWLRSTDIIQQWENLIVQPAVHLQDDGPILIVIEALDESGDPNSRTHLLSILGCRLQELPANIRILLVSRPLDDISEALEGNPIIHCKYMHDIPRSETKHDIHIYISAQLARTGKPFFDSSKIQALVNLAEGLFQWAFVACEFIKGTGKISNPKQRYNVLISSSGSTGLTQLDSLYETVLRSVLEEDNISLFRSVMGQVLGVFEPLSINALAELRSHFSLSGIDSDGDDIGLVLKHMGSLLSGTSNPSTPILPLHSSFVDYLSDERRSKEFYIDKSIHGRDLALASLEVMRIGLRFNICPGLETSYLLNSEVEHLQDRVHEFISSVLSYACRYWARHVHQTMFDLHISDAVRDFLYNQFLYWVEALSLLKCVPFVSYTLSLLNKWAQNYKEGEDIVDFSTDAQRFIRMFGGVIVQSTPHLYLSALPFTPENSIVRRKYAPRFPGTLRVASGLRSNWPACQNVLRGHQASVLCVVLSPDDTLIVSGSWDKTVRVWDAETGETMRGPLFAHTSPVDSISVSPDGRYIASTSDHKVHIWDVLTGRLIGEPLVHINYFKCVAFQLDSKHIISALLDRAIHVWNIETGKEICDALTGHEQDITCIAVSPDGKHFATGSKDCTIRIWKTGPYEDTCIILKGHSRQVLSVTYSTDGKRVVSGSLDTTIRVWDAETGVTVMDPLCGHTSLVASIAVSPDDRRLVSASYDMTIRLWDLQTGQPIAKPIIGHTSLINAVAFYRDGKRIISCADDNTIRIWDLDIAAKATLNNVENDEVRITSFAVSPDSRQIALAVTECDNNSIRIWDMVQDKMVLQAFKGHTHEILNIAYSPNGKYLVSASSETLRVWNVETGEDLLGPLTGQIHYGASALFSYDGRYVFLADSLVNAALHVWDAHTGITVGSYLPSCLGQITASPNSHQFASISTSGHGIHIFDALKGLQSEPNIDGYGSLCCIAFSRDGERIIAGSGLDPTIAVWDIRTGTAIKELSCNRRSKDHCFIRSVAVSPNDQLIIAGLEDDSIRLWDSEEGNTAAAPFTGHTAPVKSIAASPDGRCIISFSADQAVRVWDLQVGVYKDLNKRSHTIHNQSASSCVLRFSTRVEHALKNTDLLFQGFDFTTMYWKNAIEIDTGTGWIIGPKNRRLLWVPHEHLTGLITHRTKKIFGVDVTELDLSDFSHGPLWTTCFRDLEA